jgi:hypothetical protein
VSFDLCPSFTGELVGDVHRLGASLWTGRPAGRWHDRPTSPRCHAPRVLVPLEHLLDEAGPACLSQRAAVLFGVVGAIVE